MRVQPVSADLLIKLALGALVIAGVVYAARRAGQALQGALPTFTVPDFSAINPASPDNVVYRGASGLLSELLGREESVGTWLYGVTHPEPRPEVYWQTGGKWNNPSAYQAPGVTGDGGAAFGIYPRP